ncbi:MAG: hypothetical protein ACFB20_09170 [Opitutales bacterium]
MARAHPKLIDLLRDTAARLEQGAHYEWAHAGRCNCGHLAQSLTGLSAEEINRTAAAERLDEWSEFANDYCPHSGLPVDSVIDRMLDAGLELRDIHHLEYLSDKKILGGLPGGFRWLRRNRREDVALYLRTWASLLEEELNDRKLSARSFDTASLVHIDS